MPEERDNQWDLKMDSHMRQFSTVILRFKDGTHMTVSLDVFLKKLPQSLPTRTIMSLR